MFPFTPPFVSTDLSGDASSYTPSSTPAPASAGPSRTQRFLELLPQLMTSFAAGQAARARDPEVLSQIIMNFARAQEEKRREKMAEDAQALRETREQRLAEMAQQNEGLKERNLTLAEQRATEAAAHQKLIALATLQNQIEDNTRATFPAGANMDPAAIEDYLTQQSERVVPLGGDAKRQRAILQAIIHQAMAPAPQVPTFTLKPGGELPPTMAKGTVVRDQPQPREAPKPNAYTTTDENGNIFRVVEDPRTGKEISRAQVGHKPKPASSGRADALQAIIDQATGGGGRGAGPGGAPNAKTVSQTELAAIAKRRGTTVDQERARATAAGYVVR